MESGARPPLLTPHEPLPRSVSSEEPPIWEEPSEQLPRPPRLPCPALHPSGRPPTAKQYKEISLLSSVLQQGAQNAAPLPLLPIDLPSVKILVAAGQTSDSEGVVTSKREAKKLAAAAAAAAAAAEAAKAPGPSSVPARRVVTTKETPKEVEELAHLLEETLEEEEEQEEEEELENVDHDNEEATIQVALNSDPGTGSINERAKNAALKSIGYESWEALKTDLSKNAAALVAAAAASGGGSTRRKPKLRPAATITLDQVTNSTSRVYHAVFAKAYNAAKHDIEKKEAAKRKGEELQEHSLLVHRWSTLSAADHTWFLKHQGHQLIGADAERFATLSAKFEAEKLEYWAAVEQEGRAHQARYQHMGTMQGGQLDEDLKLRKKRVLETMPQFWKLRKAVDLIDYSNADFDRVAAAGRGNRHQQLFPLKEELLRQGEVPTLLRLPPKTNLPGSKLYLPAQISTEAGPRPGEAGAVYRKASTADLWQDTNLTTALQKIPKILEKQDGKHSDLIVCATAGAMLCMLRSSLLNHTPAWQIPVHVVAGGQQKRIIYLEKPLLTEKETLRLKQQRLQKYAILTEGLAHQHHRPKPSHAQPGPRETLYWLTTTGGTANSEEKDRIPLCIRTHGRILLESKPEEEENEEEGGGKEAPPEAAPLLSSAVLAVSTEYLPDPDIEQDTPEELATWWAKLSLTPGADAAAVAHVHVPSNQMVQWALWTEKDIALEFGQNKRDLEASAKRVVDTIMDSLKELEPGKYLLKHSSGGRSVEILEEEVGDLSNNGAGIYDLHATQNTAGEIDTSIDPFIPPKWRPLCEDVAQVPFTFPPEVHRRGRAGGGGGRKRRRKNTWQGDLDQVKHTGQISRSAYATQLYEGL